MNLLVENGVDINKAKSHYCGGLELLRELIRVNRFEEVQILLNVLNVPEIEQIILQAGDPMKMYDTGIRIDPHTRIYSKKLVDHTPWEQALALAMNNIDLATQMIHKLTPEGAKELRERSLSAKMMKKQSHYPEKDSRLISQIDRLKRYKDEPYYDRLKQAFLAIGITEEEILASNICWEKYEGLEVVYRRIAN